MSHIRMEIRQHADYFTIDGDDPADMHNNKGFSLSRHASSPAQIFLNTPNKAVEDLIREYGEKVAELTQSLTDALDKIEQENSHDKNIFKRKVLKVG